MKPLSLLLLSLSSFASQTLAFPASVFEAAQRDPAKFENLARELRLHSSGRSSSGISKRLNGIDPGFNATAQYISTSGIYKWVAPKKTDQRGPCPGLNAMANHGYLPHNGIATIAQFIEATTTVVGMGADLAAFLAIYGAVFDGDLTKWSIGGPSLLVGIEGLGEPEGISGSHNKYEADASPSRGDLFQYGNDYKVILSQFTALYAEQAAETEETSNYDIGVLTAFRVKRFQQSISKNKYFFNNFFSGLLVQPAGYTFQYRFMANHSAEYPEGRLSQSVLKSWFGVTGTYPKFSHKAGYERIPDNWYRRAFGDEYTIPFFLEDVVGMAVEYPQFLDVGGNQGKVNTFAGVNLQNLTGGLYDATLLLQPDYLACFVYEALVQQAPDLLEPFFYDVDAAVVVLEGGLSHLLPTNITCPSLNGVQQSQFQQAFAPFPGYTKLNSNGTY